MLLLISRGGGARVSGCARRFYAMCRRAHLLCGEEVEAEAEAGPGGGRC